MLSIRTKTIVAIVLVILSISLSYLYFFKNQQDDYQQLIIESKKNMVSVLVAALTGQIEKQYSARIQFFTYFRKDVIQAFTVRDRRALYQATQPIYKIMQREDPYFENISFVLPGNTVFLRMNDPEAYGDLEQDILQMSSNLSADPEGSLAGFVFGDKGLLYKVFKPLYSGDEHIGTVVFAVRIGRIIGEVQKELDMHTALVLRRDLLPEIHGTGGVISGDYVIYDFADLFFAENTGEIVVTATEQRVIYDDQVHVIFPSYTVNNPAGREIGSILQAVDISRIVAPYHKGILPMGIVSLLVLALSSMILYLAFSKLYGRLLMLNETLNVKNAQLEEAGKLLEENVAARTAELAEANSRLQDEIKLRHEANLSLSRSVEEWQSTFDAIADPVIILDNKLEVVIANQAAHDMLSRDEREIVGRTCHELFTGRQKRCDHCPAHGVFAKGEKKEYEVEHDFLGRNLLVSCAPIYDGAEIMGYVHTAKDITQEKILKKQLSLAQKMEAIATLAGGIAHDFNNILGAILGNADLLLFRLSSQIKGGDREHTDMKVEDIESHVQAIKKAGNRAKELVSQILAFSRQGKTQRQNAVITPVIKEAIKLLRSSLPANIEIKSDIDPGLNHIYADLSQIHQVFMNLCTNAAQAMAEKGGTLSVALRNITIGPEERKRFANLKPGSYVALSVEDDGHGMSPEIMERIFDPFFTTRDVGEGTGMGLAVIHGIITSHDGVLDVRSEVDEGTVFTVFFPSVEDSGNTEDIILGMPRGSEKILFIDDEEDIVRMTARMLEYLGYEVYPATGGEQALAMLEDKSFSVDLIITDYSMPGMSGIDLAKKMAGMRPGVPVMLCSGFSESVVFDDEARKIIRKYMSKPLDMKKLANGIREILPARKNN